MNIRPTICSRREVWALLAWLHALAWLTPLFAQSSADDYSDEQIKAALLLNFIRKTEWPKATGDLPARPVTIGVVESPKVATILRELTSGNTAQGGGPDGTAALQIRVVELKPEDDPTTCRAIYFNQSDRQAKAILARIANTPVLTVGEGRAFTDGGGIFGFERIKRKIRYWFSREAMGRSGLKISPEVIRLELKPEGSRGAE